LGTKMGMVKPLALRKNVQAPPVLAAQGRPCWGVGCRRLNRPKALMTTILNPAGFTLLEILVALAIFGVISLVIYAFFSTQFKASVTSENVAEQREVAMYAMKNLAREVRMAGYGNTTSEDITQASSSSIRFKIYDDGAGVLQTIRYSYSGTTLLRNGSPPFPNLRLQSLHFSYYDAGDTEITANLTSASVRATIRKVRLQLEAEAAPGAADVGIRPSITLRDEVKLRNIR